MHGWGGDHPCYDGDLSCYGVEEFWLPLHHGFPSTADMAMEMDVMDGGDIYGVASCHKGTWFFWVESWLLLPFFKSPEAAWIKTSLC
jgi:hypothetical protein